MKRIKVKQNVMNAKKINTAINRAKKELIQYASKNGMYENFGMEYYRAIYDKYIDVCDYSISGRRKRNLIEDFPIGVENIVLGGVKMFDKQKFLEYMEDTFIIDRFSRCLIDSIVDYGEEHCNSSKEEFVNFICDLITNADYIEYEEVAQFYK